jgi:hypothetical protein
MSAFSSGIYSSISQSLSHYSKNKEIKSDSASASEDFVFEENENESETEFEFELTAIILPYVVTFTTNELIINPLLCAEPFSVKQGKPIYLALCNFRI